MANTRRKISIRLGDLIAGLYEEAAKETKQKRLQTLLVGLALLDLNPRFKSPQMLAFRKHRPAA